MVLKKRSSSTVEEKSSKKRRKEVEDTESFSSKKSKKSKTRVPKEDPVSEEDDIEPEDDQDARDSILPMPEADMLTLFNRIEADLPVDDKRTYKCALEYVDWNSVAFNNYSAAECQNAWAQVLSKLRKFRILKEVVEEARLWLPKPWIDFKGKDKPHPMMPKRPLTSYMLFYMENQPTFAKANPGVDMTKLSSIIAARYHEISAKEKEKYKKMAESLREEYEENMRKFYLKYPELRETMERKSAVKKDPAGLGLKKPLTPQQLFIEEKMKKVECQENFSKSGVTDYLKQQWKELSDQKKLIWIRKAEENENKYLEALKLHLVENPDIKTPPYKSVLKKEELSLKEEYSGKPKTPPGSAYALFTSLMLSNNESVRRLTPSDRMKQIGSMWSQMADSEKEEYTEKLEAVREKYKLEYAAYLESLPEDERQELLMKSQTKTKAKKAVKLTNNGKDANSKPKVSNTKQVGKPKVERVYFPGEPRQPPVGAFELFVESFVADTKLSASEAPRFWEMLPSSDKSKFHNKLRELKEKYIRDYKRFLKSLDEEQVAKYNQLQQRNKERELRAEEREDSDNEVDEPSEEDSSSEDEDIAAVKDDDKKKDDDDDDDDDDDSDSDEKEVKKPGSTSDSNSSSSESSSSSSSEDSDSSSEDSDDEDRKGNQNKSVKKEISDSDSSDDE